jgi:ApbE superfamily uncharacterized protein (UPF0280 family)
MQIVALRPAAYDPGGDVALHAIKRHTVIGCKAYGTARLAGLPNAKQV